MAAAEVDSKSEAPETVPAPEQEQMLDLMNYSQRGRMDEQRCALSPAKTGQSTKHEETSHKLDYKQEQHLQVSLPGFNYQEPGSRNHHGSAPQIALAGCTPDGNKKHLMVPDSQLKVEPPDEQLAFMNIICNAQRGRMDDQCCSLDFSKSAPCSPKNKNRKSAASASSTAPDTDFLNLLASTQSQRLDDQRVTLATLPGLQKKEATTAADNESSYLCYMISKVQGSDMDDQRCSLPQIVTPTPQSKDKSVSDAGPPRSASSSPGSDIEKPKSKDKAPQKQSLSPGDQEDFLSLMSHSQRGRMDEQRCTLTITPKSTPKHTPSQSPAPKAPDTDFLNLLASSQSRRLDDQRVTLATLPGLQKREATSTSTTPRSSPKHKPSPSPAPQAPDTDFLNLLASTQSQRLDDQRVTLATLPGLQKKEATTAADNESSYLCYMISKVQGSDMDDQRCSLPQIVTPTPQSKDKSVSDAGPPRSASSSPGSDIEKPKSKDKAPQKQSLSPGDQEDFLSLMSHSQRGRMDEQRCTLTITPKSTPKHTPSQSPAPKAPDTDFLNLLASSQSRRLDDQRVTLATLPGLQKREATSTSTTPRSSPKHKPSPSPALQAPDTDFLNLLASTQSQRLDDQRVTLATLPGLQKKEATTAADNESSYLCYMISKVQGSDMDDQRCSLPQIVTPTPQSKDKSVSDAGPPRSASSSPGSDIEKPKSKDKAPQKQSLSPGDQEDFLSLMSHSQRGRMDEQRCTLTITPKSTPKHTPSQSPAPKAPDTDFLNLLASSQSRRLDDQRVTLATLPGLQKREATSTSTTPRSSPKHKPSPSPAPQGIQNGGSTSTSNAAEMDASYLCYMVSKVQGSRMDEQRCSAPLRSQNTPSTHDTSDKLPQRSGSLNRAKTDQHREEASPGEQERFFKMISHAQGGRMDEQRCSLQPNRGTTGAQTHNGSALNNRPTGADADALFNMLASSQSRRLDDQRVALPALSERKEHSGNIKAASPPHITVAESTPTTPRKDGSRPNSQPQMDYTEGLPKSASFTPETEHMKKHSPAQVRVKVSMSFTPPPGQNNITLPFPEIFLTVGAPGDNLVIPLSPAPGRPLSFDLNLIPKEDMDCSPSPRKAHSRPSSPRPGDTSKASHPHDQGDLGANPVSPDDDCFSLIEKVHTAQLQRAMHQGQKCKDQGKGKKAVKKDKKDGGNK